MGLGSQGKQAVPRNGAGQELVSFLCKKINPNMVKPGEEGQAMQETRF